MTRYAASDRAHRRHQPGVRSADADDTPATSRRRAVAAAAGARIVVWREMTLPFDPASKAGRTLRALATATRTS